MFLESSIRSYPYKERLPYAILMLCVTAWMLHGDRPKTVVDFTLIGSVIATFFCGPKERMFWLFWGVAIGALIASVSFGHSLHVR
jgi:hypothetical protein